MDACSCGAGPGSAITFDGGVEMLRCRLCGASSWLLDGRAVSHETAHTALKGTFISTRRQAVAPRAPRQPRQPRVVDLRDLAPAGEVRLPDAPAPAAEPVDLNGALAELLRSKGVGGSWTVTG